MLLKLLTMAMCCQFTVSVERPQFTVSVVQDVVVQSGGQQVRLKPTDRPDRFSFSSEPVPSRRYLAMFTASYCAPCQTWKRTVLPRLRANGHYVKVIEMSDAKWQRKYSRRIKRYPSFAVIDWETGNWLSDVTVGGISQATAERMLVGSSEAPQRVVASSRVSPPISAETLIPRMYTYQRQQYDLATFGTCDGRYTWCSMCFEIGAMQDLYRAQQQRLGASTSKSSEPAQGKTADHLIAKIPSLAVFHENTLFADAGSGDGSVVIDVVRRTGCRGLCVEWDSQLVAECTAAVARAGLSDRIEVVQMDLFDWSPRDAGVDVLYVYQWGKFLKQLAPVLAESPVVISLGHEVPGFTGGIQADEFWLYENGGRNAEVVEDNAVRSIRGNRFTVGTGPNIAR